MNAKDGVERALIAGVDEVGVGPLAGPVIAAAVILRRCQPIDGLADSKRLSPARRETLSVQIQDKAVAWALGRADVEEVDRLNVLNARLLAMARAVAALCVTPTLALVDGLHVPDLACEARAIVRGDAQVAEISAASVIAKVARDHEMREWHAQYPGYGFDQHKGYGTAAHLAALARLGPCPIHRVSFAPVRAAMTGGG